MQKKIRTVNFFGIKIMFNIYWYLSLPRGIRNRVFCPGIDFVNILQPTNIYMY